MAAILIVGAGHNGLVAAALVARAGHDTVVLERRDQPGGALAIEEVHPGYRCPLQSGVGGALLPAVSRALGLDGTAPASPAPLVAFDDDGGAVVMASDRDVEPIGRQLDPKERARFAVLTGMLGRAAGVLAPLLTTPPPSIGAPTIGALLALAGTGWRVRGLGRRDGQRLLQWAPMPVADLAADWLEDPLLQAVVAARGIFGRFAGPRSGGTALELLLHAARTGWVMVEEAGPVGPHDATRQALAAAAARAGARVRTAAAVAQILVDDGRAIGVRLETGEELRADVVVSNADPRHTLLGLVDAAWLPPEFVADVANIRAQGVVAKVHLALSALPRFTALAGLPADRQVRLLAGRLHFGATPDALERAFDAAKYGEYSPRPYVELTIPSLREPGLAPPGHHVASAHVQFAPRVLRGRTWAAAAAGLAAAVLDRLEEHAPGLRALVVGQQVITPEDLERRHGLPGGHLHHGEHALDQLFVMRPVYGWADYRTPVRGLYLCGAGTHPGGGVHGACGLNAARTILRDLG